MADIYGVEYRPKGHNVYHSHPECGEGKRVEQEHHQVGRGAPGEDRRTKHDELGRRIDALRSEFGLNV
jgi:hypothetical protein